MQTSMTSEAVIGQDHGTLYHLIQTDLWQQAKQSGRPYFPPTYDAVSATSHTLLLGHLQCSTCMALQSAAARHTADVHVQLRLLAALTTSPSDCYNVQPCTATSWPCWLKTAPQARA